MAPTTTACFFSLPLFLLLLVSVSRAEMQAGDRAPHGLANQNPISLSPSSYDFFHPNDAAHQPASATTGHSCSTSKCSSFSMRASEVHQPTLPGNTPSGSRGVGACGIAWIVVGLASALLVALGAYYVVVTRRSNSHKINSPFV